MWRAIVIALTLAACTQIPPSPEEIQSKNFEPVPEKAIVYIVRTPMDSDEPGSLILDDNATLTTYRRTFYRWEIAPGRHRVAGFAGQSGQVELDAEAGRIYFVEHTVHGSLRSGVKSTALRRIDEKRGQQLVRSSGLL